MTKSAQVPPYKKVPVLALNPLLLFILMYSYMNCYSSFDCWFEVCELDRDTVFVKCTCVYINVCNYPSTVTHKMSANLK